MTWSTSDVLLAGFTLSQTGEPCRVCAGRKIGPVFTICSSPYHVPCFQRWAQTPLEDKGSPEPTIRRKRRPRGAARPSTVICDGAGSASR